MGRPLSRAWERMEGMHLRLAVAGLLAGPPKCPRYPPAPRWPPLTIAHAAPLRRPAWPPPQHPPPPPPPAPPPQRPPAARRGRDRRPALGHQALLEGRHRGR